MKGGETVRQGGCLCGAVRYEVRGPMRGVVNCHCDMCRRLHGAFGAYTKVENSDLSLVEEAGLAMRADGCASLQIIFNLFRQDYIDEVFPEAIRKNVGRAAPASFGSRAEHKPLQSPPELLIHRAAW